MSRPPGTASETERRLDAAAEDRLGRAPVELAAALWDPDRAPREWLPRLAAVFRVPVFSDGWSEADQRRAIKESLVERRAGGTQAGMELALDAGGAVYSYREPDAAYTAEIDILNPDATTLPVAEIARILQSRKRAAVRLTVNQVARAVELDIPVRSGLGATVVAPMLIGKL